MTATYQMALDLGWEYFEKLAKQKVMQVQSSADPPKKLALGERAVMADGNEYNIFIEKEKGTPVEIVYATEGSPLIVGPNGRPIRTPRGYSRASAFLRRRNSSASMSGAYDRCIRRPKTSQDASPSARSRR